MRSIRLRFMILLSLLLSLLLLLLNTYPAILARDAVFQEKHSAMNSRALVLSVALEDLERLSGDGVAEVLTFLDLSELERVAVFDRGGAALFDNRPGSERPADLDAALAGKVIFRSHFVRAAFLSSIVMPVSSGERLIGAIYLQERDEAHAGAIRAVQQHLITLSFIIAFTVLVSGGLFVRRFSGRLRSLALSMRRVAEGDYGSRPTIRGQDEISALGTEFNTLTERLERTENERQRFVADASHELKTPIAAIRLLSDSILHSPNVDADTAREFVADIGEEALRLQKTTEKLLTLSRLVARADYLRAPLELADAAHSAVESLRAYARENFVALQEALEPGCVILGSQDDIDHILYNLIDNAIKYNVPGGSVLVRLRACGAEAELVVEDTGIGIPPQDLPHIFDRFYRVDKARSREEGGSGLGLSIVHEAVLAQNGSIRVEQNKPQGTRFLVRFPRI